MTQRKYSYHVKHPVFQTWEEFKNQKAQAKEVARLQKRYPSAVIEKKTLWK